MLLLYEPETVAIRKAAPWSKPTRDPIALIENGAPGGGIQSEDAGLTPEPYRLPADAPPKPATSAYEENLARAAGNLSEKSIEAKDDSASARAGAHASNIIIEGIERNLECHCIGLPLSENGVFVDGLPFCCEKIASTQVEGELITVTF